MQESSPIPKSFLPFGNEVVCDGAGWAFDRKYGDMRANPDVTGFSHAPWAGSAGSLPGMEWGQKAESIDSIFRIR